MLVKRWLLKAYGKPYSNVKVIFFNMSYAVYEFCIYVSIHFYRGGVFSMIKIFLEDAIK